MQLSMRYGGSERNGFGEIMSQKYQHIHSRSLTVLFCDVYSWAQMSSSMCTEILTSQKW